MNQYLVAYVYYLDRGDGIFINRIYAQRLDAGGGLIGGKSEVGSSAGHTINPHLIYNTTSQEYLLVWSGQDAGGDYDIFAQRIHPDGGLTGGTINVSTWENHQLRPRLAYNPARNETLAVWQDYHWDIGISQIYGRRIKADGTLAGSAILPLNQSSKGNRYPDAAYLPMAHGFLVVWEYLYNYSSYDIYRALLSDIGQALQPATAISALSSNEERPAVASDSFNKAQFIWEDNRNFSVSGIDIYGLHQELPFEDKYLPVIFRR